MALNDTIASTSTWRSTPILMALREANIHAEALESLEAEGVDHETAMIIDTTDGPIVVYAMQTDDLERSRAVAEVSPRPVDAEHRAVMRAADGGPAAAQIVLDLRAGER